MEKHPKGILLDKTTYKKLVETIDWDTDLLMDMGTMDYSLLLGYRKLKPGEHFDNPAEHELMLVIQVFLINKSASFIPAFFLLQTKTQRNGWSNLRTPKTQTQTGSTIC